MSAELGGDLTASVRYLVAQALELALDETTSAQLQDTQRRLSEPLRVAIAGRVKAGKSTLLNALVGEELAPTDAGECTRLVTWYVGGNSPRVAVHHRDGRVEQRPYRRATGALTVDLGVPVDDVDHLEVTWPSSRLSDVTLIDTPGIGSLSAETSLRATALLPGDDERTATVDAVLYLLRHAHADDIRFLDAFHDDEFGRGTPVNAVGVLSRADEIGSLRLDALDVAARVAARYRSDRRIRKLCPLVVPVAGLVGHAAMTLRQNEYQVLARLADLPRERLDRLLLTADRFLDTQVPVPRRERAYILDRLGLFGVRDSLRAIEAGEARSAAELAARLNRVSGLDDLREILLRQFTERSRLLRARSALTAVRAVIRRGGCAEPGRLETIVEEVTSSAHEFREIQLLNDLRAGAVTVPESHREEAERLLGATGFGIAARLGLPPGAADGVISRAALGQLGFWQTLAGSPGTSRQLRVACWDIVRTVEGIIACAERP
ncbi:dynamin family protein [Kineosporia sp. J2-2]|uniref:Dynamin family protein n=1 Tax=Kineosporia corallincola TaxID=2835133 RepID=A0ABS5TDD2_9ACTN|nr:dynamin family protein [Kineosporia corallincola]MBT0768206.1 dynamin family protein [Kineosporia corallincola]